MFYFINMDACKQIIKNHVSLFSRTLQALQRDYSIDCFIQLHDELKRDILMALTNDTWKFGWRMMYDPCSLHHIEFRPMFTYGFFL